MKKILFALLFAVPAIGFAQVNQNVEASAVIAASIAVDGLNTQDLTFGSIDNSANAVSIAATDGALTGNLLSAQAQRGMVAVNGLLANVIFTISGDVTGTTANLADLDSNPLNVALSFAVATTVAATEGTTYILGQEVAGSGASFAAKLFIGGEITGGEKDGLAAGTYSGDITVTIAYN